MNTGDFPFSEFLESEPRAAYFGQSSRFGSAPRRQKYFEGAFQNVYDQYLGQLGRMANVQDPAMETYGFNDWLKNTYRFDNDWGSMTPRERGESRGAFAPNARWFMGR